MAILRFFRSVPDALQALCASLERLVVHTIEADALGPPGAISEAELFELRARVDQLERSLAMWEAETEAKMLEAGEKLRLARNAEERARYKAKKYAEADEGDEESMDDLPQEYLELLQGRNGEGGEAGGMHPVHQGMGANGQAGEVSSRELARMKKWGMM